MIQTEAKIHRHERSVALARARLFRCYKTHLDSNWYQKKRVEKKKKNTKYIKKGNYRFDFIIIREKKKILHR